MGHLFDCRSKLDRIIEERKLDKAEIYGKVGLKAGFLISVLKTDTPDNDVRLLKLRQAVQEILQVQI